MSLQEETLVSEEALDSEFSTANNRNGSSQTPASNSRSNVDLSMLDALGDLEAQTALEQSSSPVANSSSTTTTTTSSKPQTNITIGSLQSSLNDVGAVKEKMGADYLNLQTLQFGSIPQTSNKTNPYGSSSNTAAKGGSMDLLTSAALMRDLEDNEKKFTFKSPHKKSYGSSLKHKKQKSVGQNRRRKKNKSKGEGYADKLAMRRGGWSQSNKQRRRAQRFSPY